MLSLRNKVMIVDDNPIDHMITRYVLQNNYQVEEMSVMESALEALIYLEDNKDNLQELPSAIILDLDMPNLNGIGFLEQFSKYSEELKKSCKIIVLTASDILKDVETMKSFANVSELINKPLSKNGFLSLELKTTL